MPCEPGRARQLADMNRRGSTGGSWHYAVDPTTTLQTSFDSYVCHHAPPNGHSIGIEMTDMPGPTPKSGPGTAAFRAAVRVWRWRKPEQQAMLRRTARLVAELCAAYGLPPSYVNARQLKRGAKGWTTHRQVSVAFRQSSHWDPGLWPLRKFKRLVREHHTEIMRKASR
jgi:hypothetical protein